jgi:hypothetical protein
MLCGKPPAGGFAVRVTRGCKPTQSGGRSGGVRLGTRRRFAGGRSPAVMYSAIQFEGVPGVQVRDAEGANLKPQLGNRAGAIEFVDPGEVSSGSHGSEYTRRIAMMRLLFYWGRGDLVTKLSRLLTHGPCSHVELQFTDGTRVLGPSVLDRFHDTLGDHRRILREVERDGTVEPLRSGDQHPHSTSESIRDPGFVGLGQTPGVGNHCPLDPRAPGGRYSFAAENGQRHLETVAVGTQDRRSETLL